MVEGPSWNGGTRALTGRGRESCEGADEHLPQHLHLREHLPQHLHLCQSPSAVERRALSGQIATQQCPPRCRGTAGHSRRCGMSPETIVRPLRSHLLCSIIKPASSSRSFPSCSLPYPYACMNARLKSRPEPNLIGPFRYDRNCRR